MIARLKPQAAAVHMTHYWRDSEGTWNQKSLPVVGRRLP